MACQRACPCLSVPRNAKLITPWLVVPKQLYENCGLRNIQIQYEYSLVLATSDAGSLFKLQLLLFPATLDDFAVSK